MPQTVDMRHVENYLRREDQCHVAIAHLPAKLPALAHCHDFYEVFWLRCGSCRHLVNGTEQHLARGNLVFIRPADTHCFQATQAQTSLVNIVLPKDYIEHLGSRYHTIFGDKYFWQTQVHPQVFTLPPGSVESLDNSIQQLSNSTKDPLQLDLTMLTLMQQIRPAADALARTAPAWLRRALNQARDPQVFKQGAPGLVQVAGRVHAHVCRSTRRYLGKTPSAIVNEYRCEYAATQLANNCQQIADIADFCGFENPSHFFRVFKQYYGQTPREYRIARQQSVV